MRFKQALFAFLLAVGSGGAAQAQHLLLASPAASGLINDPITFEIVADGHIGGAVAWGTTIALSDPLHLTYQPNFDGKGDPYRSLQPFFDMDFSDTSALGNGQLKLNFLNTTPGQNFGYNGIAPLAEFQAVLGSGLSPGTDLTVTLAQLGIPPDGTAVQDSSANNILLPSDPAHPSNNVSTAHILIGGGNGHPLFWEIGGAAVPEPTGWLSLLSVATGVCGGVFLRRHRVKRHEGREEKQA